MSRNRCRTLTTLFMPTKVAAARIRPLAVLTLVCVRHSGRCWRLEVDTVRDIGNVCGFYKGKSPQPPFPLSHECHILTSTPPAIRLNIQGWWLASAAP